MAGYQYILETEAGALASTLPASRLLDLVSLQLSNNFGHLDTQQRAELERIMPTALVLVHKCFSRVNNSYYCKDGAPHFKILHSGNYCMFLHFMTRAAHEALGQDNELCDKLFYLNRIMHGVDLFYGAGLPDVFFVEHPLGSCLGRAS